MPVVRGHTSCARLARGTQVHEQHGEPRPGRSGRAVRGRCAFKGTTAADTLSAILREDPTETIGTGSALPPGLLRVVRRCLEKTPEDRIPTHAGRADPCRVPTAAALGLWAGQRLKRPGEPPIYQRLTFRLGDIRTAFVSPLRQPAAIDSGL